MLSSYKSRKSNGSRPSHLSSAMRRGCSWITKHGQLQTNAPFLSTPGKKHGAYIPLVSSEDFSFENVIKKNVCEMKVGEPQKCGRLSHIATPARCIDTTVEDDRDDHDTKNRFYSRDDVLSSCKYPRVNGKYVSRNVRSLIPLSALARTQMNDAAPKAPTFGLQLQDESCPPTRATASLSPPTHLSVNIDCIKNASITKGTFGCIIDGSCAISLSSGHGASSQACLCVERPIIKSGMVRTSRQLGAKVTVLSESLKIFIIHLLPPDACERIRFITQKHVKHMNAIGRSDMTYRAFYTYTEMDIPCCEISGLVPFMDQVCVSVNQIVAHVLGEPQAVHLKPRSWTEPHILKYDYGQNHTGIIMHHDGSDFTWNLMLSHSSEYTGGGTYIRALRRTVMLRQGQVLVHPGDLFHQGLDITSGTRELVVCFLDGHASNVKDSSTNADDNENFKKDVLRV